jgi:ERCC4-type nuclease
MELVIDVREHALCAELTRLAIPYIVAPLDAGDILIRTGDGAHMLVAERKSHADFAASNQDGRYREQRGRLMAIRGAGVAVLYIVEGHWAGDDNRQYGGGRATEGLIKRLTTRLMLRYGLPVILSESMTETAQWCRTLLAQLTDDGAVFQPENGAVSEAMAGMTAALSVVKKGNKTPMTTAAAMLSAIPGLGEKRIAALLGIHSIAELTALASSDVSALVVGGKRIGDKLATTIVEALRAKA